MFRGSIVLRFLAAVLVLGILVAAGAMIFQAGQAQGYALGVANAGKELAPAVPPGQMPYYGPYFYPGFGFWPHFFFFPFGLFFFGLFFFFVIGGLFRRRMWGHGGWGNGPRQGEQNPPPANPGQQQPPNP